MDNAKEFNKLISRKLPWTSLAKHDPIMNEWMTNANASEKNLFYCPLFADFGFQVTVRKEEEEEKVS